MGSYFQILEQLFRWVNSYSCFHRRLNDTYLAHVLASCCCILARALAFRHMPGKLRLTLLPAQINCGAADPIGNNPPPFPPLSPALSLAPIRVAWYWCASSAAMQGGVCANWGRQCDFEAASLASYCPALCAIRALPDYPACAISSGAFLRVNGAAPGRRARPSAGARSARTCVFA